MCHFFSKHSNMFSFCILHWHWHDTGTLSCHHGTLSCHHGTLSCHHGTLSCHHGTLSCHHGTLSCHHGSLSCPHGSQWPAYLSLSITWPLISKVIWFALSLPWWTENILNKPRWMACLLMPWPLAVPCHQQPLCVISLTGVCRVYGQLENTDTVIILISQFYFVISDKACQTRQIWRFDSCDRPSNLTQIGFKSSIFQPCDLEIWLMTSKNYRAPLLHYIKLCASSQTPQWIGTAVAVQKLSIRVKIDDLLPCVTLKFNEWPWKTIGILFYVTLSFCASFQSHRWFQTKVSVRKRSIRAKMDDFLPRVTSKFDG